MPPRETSPLISSSSNDTKPPMRTKFSMDNDEEEQNGSSFYSIICRRKELFVGTLAVALIAVLLFGSKTSSYHENNSLKKRLGPYKLVERQEGREFFDYYSFYDGADSLGSAGYNSYIGKKRALELGLVNVTKDETDGTEYVYMNSAATAKGPRESVRLEGNRRFDRGLFILDLSHMPAGCGVWPAFWLTDEDNWPKNGEIDIVEGVNYQVAAKTALHTSESCSMYAHSPSYAFTGEFDRATGLPDTFTGIPATETSVPADNCWNLAPHQWANQGCVIQAERNDTIGQPLNEQGGGVYALEWDPANGYIKSWVFPSADDSSSSFPDNLRNTIETAGAKNAKDRILPEPSSWGLPYAYFAIGDRSGCSADHFKNMRIVFNLAFCGTVAGNRFFRDCPLLANKFNVSGDPVESCNAYIKSEPKELEEAYWKIRGVYVYEREYGKPTVVDDEEQEIKG